ncbi:MAG: hypothetical protein ACC726_09635 [Chloroflexota bacterium]
MTEFGAGDAFRVIGRLVFTGPAPSLVVVVAPAHNFADGPLSSTALPAIEREAAPIPAPAPAPARATMAAARFAVGDTVPVLATFFSVRRGRDPFFKFFMQKLFPRQVKRYEEEFGVRFLGWYNVAYGWDFDNVILLELPDYETIDKLEADERSRAIGHRAGEWMFERHHAMFLRERMGADLKFHP